MDQSPQTSLVVTNGNDDVNNVLPLVPPPDSTVNFADDPDSKQWVELNVVGLIQHARGEYGGQHQEWSNIRRMANITRDFNAAYNGTSQVYLPVYQRALETRVSHTSRGLFPSDTYIDATVMAPPGIPQLAAAQELMRDSVKAWMSWQLENSAQLRAAIKPFLRNLFNYGTSIAKVYWEKPPADQKRTRMASLPGVSGLLSNYGNAYPWQCEGLRFKATNPFATYVWPVSVNSLAEASLIFEDIQTSKQFIMEMGKKGVWKNWEKALEGWSVTPEVNNQIQQTLIEQHNGSETAVDYQAGELANWRYLTECWFRMPVPRGLYRPGEIPGTSVQVKAIIAGGQIVELRRNPFWHQQPPYLMMRLNENMDSFFSIGMGRAAAGLQYLINDFANQTNDNGMYALNPIVKYNPNLITGPLEPLEPGRMWPMVSMDAMEFDRPPVEQLQYGMQLQSMFISQLNDMSGAPAVLQGSGSQGGAKTATGAQILQGNVKGDLQDIIEDIELRVMIPLLTMAHSLGQQYERSERWFAISGGQKVQFTPGQLELDLMWRWVASSQATNQQMRAQQLQAFIMAFSNPAVLQGLAAQGKTINPEPVLRKFWEDGLGMRNFSSVVIPLPMMPMMGAGGPSGQSGMPPGAGPQEPRSATEQAPGGGGPMVPGEGEAFGEVRAGADQMAAQMGGFGGGM